MDWTKRVRKPDEILFRLKQEAFDLWLLVSQPGFAGELPAPLAGLPDPRATAEALRGTAFAAEIERLAGETLQHRFPVLGYTIDTGAEIEWRRDYVHGIASRPAYFRFVPYLDFSRCGDHKAIWELNRHQHWVLLAQAFLFTERRAYLDEIEAEFESWNRQNPFLRGINWASALEVAFRALSWTWVYHLVGDRLERGVRQRLLSGLCRHGCYLERNLSVYFSPNTHLLGEAVALHGLGVLFPGFPRARQWAGLGARIVERQMECQVREDGSHFEQSTYYHVYALDMFLFHALLAEVPPAYRSRLERMAEYLAAVMGPSRCLPFLGDEDGGRFFHPYGQRDRFGRATLATAAVLSGGSGGASEACDLRERAWWLGPNALQTPERARAEHRSRLFPEAGLAVLTSGDVQVAIDAGPFGSGSGGHSHSDTLSVVVRAGEEEALIDCGTYTYLGDPLWRDWFRGSAAHNTVRVGALDQAVPATPFRWTEMPRVEIRQAVFAAAHDYLDAACSYRGIAHRRRFLFVKPDRLFILDELTGPRGGQVVEQFWHSGERIEPLSAQSFRLGARSVLTLTAPAELSEGGEHGWRSRVYGVKEPAPVIRTSQAAVFPLLLGAMLQLSAAARPWRLRLVQSRPEVVELQFDGEETGCVRFPAHGLPEYDLGERRPV